MSLGPVAVVIQQACRKMCKLPRLLFLLLRVPRIMCCRLRRRSEELYICLISGSPPSSPGAITHVVAFGKLRRSTLLCKSEKIEKKQVRQSAHTLYSGLG